MDTNAKYGHEKKVPLSLLAQAATEKKHGGTSLPIEKTFNGDTMNGKIDEVLAELKCASADLKQILKTRSDNDAAAASQCEDRTVASLNIVPAEENTEIIAVNGHAECATTSQSNGVVYCEDRNGGSDVVSTHSCDSLDQVDGSSENSFADSIAPLTSRPRSRLPRPAEQKLAVRELGVQDANTADTNQRHSFRAVASMVHSCSATGLAPTRRRSASLADVNRAPPAPRGHVNLPRENAASRKRIEATGQKNVEVPEPDYMTPLQRKDVIIKDLKTELREVQKICDGKAEMVEMRMDGQRLEYEEKILLKDDLIHSLDDTLKQLEVEYAKVISERDAVTEQLHQLTLEHESLKDDFDAREKKHQEMYLEMYNKGMDSARFERRDELEAIARSDIGNVSVSELLEKLKITEQELEWWQSARRNELYKETAPPETSADATLRFLRDSMYHYLISGPYSEQHLKAVIGIFKYTDAQMRNITKAAERRKKKKSTS